MDFASSIEKKLGRKIDFKKDVIPLKVLLQTL